MVMVGHSQRLAQPLTRGQRRTIAAAVLVAVLAAVLLAIRPGSTPASHAGCVRVVVASSTGGVVISHCGAAARSWCVRERAATDQLALAVQAQCRLAGLPAPARSPAA